VSIGIGMHIIVIVRKLENRACGTKYRYKKAMLLQTLQEFIFHCRSCSVESAAVFNSQHCSTRNIFLSATIKRSLGYQCFKVFCYNHVMEIRIQNHKYNEVENAFPIFKVSRLVVRVRMDSHHNCHNNRIFVVSYV